MRMMIRSFLPCATWLSFPFFLTVKTVGAFTPLRSVVRPDFFQNVRSTSRAAATRLYSIGLGPTAEQLKQQQEEEDAILIPGVDYEVPDHEKFRTSRRSKVDERCDDWFGELLGTDPSTDGFLGDVASETRKLLTTPVELKNEYRKSYDDPDFTPYVSTKLPWTPLVPSFGLEKFGIPVPRRKAEAWLQSDVVGMISQDYSLESADKGKDLVLTEEQVEHYKQNLYDKGGWLDDEACKGRLVYINGRFCPQLSKTTDDVRNMEAGDISPLKDKLSRLTDGFTDQLAAPVPSEGEDTLTSYRALSKPNHNLGDPTSQFAINSQQGTACFAALNTVKTGAVAYIREKAGTDDETSQAPLPVLLVNAITKDGGVGGEDAEKGAMLHPRALVIAEDDSRLSFVQSTVDIDDGIDRPMLYNGYTQIFVGANANVTHSFLEESGGIPIGGTEVTNEDWTEGNPPPRELESRRPALNHTHLEIIDAHITGEKGYFSTAVMAMGGSGRVRVCLGVSLLKPGAETDVGGFTLSGGSQRTDVKTNIHHIAQGTTSRQLQKTVVGGRASGAFRGRVRVEQSAQQTDSEQLSRTILLSDRSQAWAIPSLEIIADDVKCTHGATISDLSDEELFYLRSRGVERKVARNLLMYAFAGQISQKVDPAMMNPVGTRYGLQQRVIQRLENLVPRGERAIMGAFQSV